ncbi:MAG TPA: BlaI/MecI/CopY family transcriptional regulator [Woeseiaceae bacterium]|nr:BlaI/MecI/CopY family transcriptional regulator [Woeseiaceae bacterium]
MSDEELSAFELEVLQHLWHLEQASTPELHRRVCNVRDVKYSTVRTIVDRLERKQAIERIAQQGRAQVFRPLLSKAEVSLPMTRKFVDRVFAGDSRPLLSHLLDSATLDSRDIAYLESVIARRKSELDDND